jgi:hypothetical protein
MKTVEFRIPISPTESFFAQVRFFNFALRRLGAPYRDARLLIVVGDDCNIDDVRMRNQWSESFNVAWEAVPHHVWAEFGVWGTANWRLAFPAGNADIVILSDADTVLLRDIDPLLAAFPAEEVAIRGHMAYRPPILEVEGIPDRHSADFWPWIFGAFNLPWPSVTYSYSIDPTGNWPKVPAYFNLGFVALSPSALRVLGMGIEHAERRVNALTASPMRCQIATTILAYRAQMNIATLPAPYNTGNEIAHLELNGITADDIRVLHYLQRDEIDRSLILLPAQIDRFLAQRLGNPANIALQSLVREYRETLR